MQSMHEGVRYPCNQCVYSATQSGSLKRHIQSMHEGVRYPCNQCEYSATTTRSLKRHIQSIHQEARYPCNQCEFSAIDSFCLYLPQIRSKYLLYFKCTYHFTCYKTVKVEKNREFTDIDFNENITLLQNYRNFKTLFLPKCVH